MKLKKVKCRHCAGSGYFFEIDETAARKARERSGLSLRLVAKRVGISPMYLCDMERGRRRYSQEMFERVLAALRAGGE